MEATLQVVRNKPTRLAASSRFGPFKPESEQRIRSVLVQQDPKLEAMMAAWKSVEYSGQNSGECYGNCVTAVRNRDYSAKEVERFSLSIAEFQNEDGFGKKFGLFLSALVNEGKNRKYTLRTGHLGVKIECLGYENIKHVTVKGDAGKYFGYMMKRGRIFVDGNAADCGYEMRGTIIVTGDVTGQCGSFMRGGRILVEGNACHCGGSMHKGKITVRGNVTDDCGSQMHGGKIMVDGDVRGLCGSGMNGGRIHVKGDIVRMGVPWALGDGPDIKSAVLRSVDKIIDSTTRMITEDIFGLSGKIYRRGVRIHPERGVLLKRWDRIIMGGEE